MDRKNFNFSASQRGVGWIAISCFLWAGGGLLEKHLLFFINPVALAFIVSCFAALALIAANRFAIKTLWQQFFFHPWLYLGVGLTGFALPYPLFYEALKYLPLGVAASLIKLQPVFILIFACFFLSEKLNFTQIIASMIAILCALLVSVPMSQLIEMNIDNVSAFLMGMGAALSFSISSLCNKKIMNHNRDPLQAAAMRFIIGSALLMPYLFLTHSQHDLPQLPPHEWWTVIALGILSEAVAMVVYYKGMRHVKISLATIFELLQTLFSVLLGFVFLRERLEPSQYLAMTGLLAAVTVVALYEDRATKMAELHNLP